MSSLALQREEQPFEQEANYLSNQRSDRTTPITDVHESMPTALTPDTPDLREGPPAVVLATAGYDHTIRFWDVVRGLCIGTLQHNESQVNCLALSRDKLLLAAGGNPAIRIYDTVAATRNTMPIALEAVGDVEEASAAASVTSPSTMVTTTAPPLKVLEGHRGNVMALGFHPEGKWLWSAGEDCTLRIWQLEEGPEQFECIKEIALRVPLNCVALEGDQLFFLGDAKGRILVWDAKKFIPLLEMANSEPSTVALRSITTSPDGGLVATIDQSAQLTVWSVDRSSSTSSLPASFDLKRLVSLEAHEKAFATKCLFSPDGRSILTTASDGLAKLWGLTLSGHHSVESLPLASPLDQGTLNRSGGYPSLIARANARLELCQVFSGHSKWVWDCAFSADSAYIVTASSDNTARLWDATTAETIAIYSGHSKALISLALNDLPLDHENKPGDS